MSLNKPMRGDRLMDFAERVLKILEQEGPDQHERMTAIQTAAIEGDLATDYPDADSDKDPWIVLPEEEEAGEEVGG